jgi:long-subunit fatty acid transport protein
MAGAGFPYGKYEEKLVDKVEYGLISSLEISSQSTVSKGVEDVRGVVSAIVIPTFIWAPPPGMKTKNTYVPTFAIPTAAFGLSYRMDDDLPGFGSFVRFSLLSPRLDLNMGVAFGVERYTWDAEESYRFHPEVRVGVGVSLVSFIGAVGYDHALNAQRNLEGSVVVRAGVQFALPWSKISRRQPVHLQCEKAKD